MEDMFAGEPMGEVGGLDPMLAPPPGEEPLPGEDEGELFGDEGFGDDMPFDPERFGDFDQMHTVYISEEQIEELEEMGEIGLELLPDDDPEGAPAEPMMFTLRLGLDPALEEEVIDDGLDNDLPEGEEDIEQFEAAQPQQTLEEPGGTIPEMDPVDVGEPGL